MCASCSNAWPHRVCTTAASRWRIKAQDSWNVKIIFREALDGAKIGIFPRIFHFSHETYFLSPADSRDLLLGKVSSIGYYFCVQIEINHLFRQRVALATTSRL